MTIELLTFAVEPDSVGESNDVEGPTRDELLAKIEKQRIKLAKLKRERDRWREKAQKNKANANAAKRRYQALVDPPEPSSPIAGPDTPIDEAD